MEKTYYIGIDPGTNTGLAIWNKKDKRFIRVETTSIHKALFSVHAIMLFYKDIEVVIEDARHIGGAGIKAQGAGSIKRDCSIWEDFCVDYKIPHRFVRPSKRSMTKLSKEEFKRITGWGFQTSTHARDACLLVYGT
jgi:hypothetical protein